MSDNLTKFLIALASDPDRMTRFVTDPDGELDKAGLTPEEKAAVMTHDPAQLRGALGASPADVLTRVLKKKRKKAAKKRKAPGRRARKRAKR